MNVLVDYHHGNLYYSFHLLFEKRLGFQMFRPIGNDWFTNGYFRVAEPYGNAEDTIGQYLGINSRHWDSFTNLNGDYKLEDDIYHIQDPENNFQHKAVTFDKFKQMKFDYIVASFPLHDNWQHLLQYQPQAKFIQQVGNEGQVTDAKNVMCSTADFVPKEHQKVINLHQEFDLTDYKYVPPKSHDTITSFVVSLPEPEVYETYKNLLPEFEFHAYGVGSPDGTISGSTIPQRMRDSAFGYQNKKFDGFGHLIHKWMACGRPVIVNYDDYKNKMAGPLLIPDKTCISLNQPIEDVLRKIRYFAEPERHRKMCYDTYMNFKEIVNFDRESSEFKEWLKVI